MFYCLIARYFRFLSSRKSVYLAFNKQLLVAELAGFAAGVIAAEAAASISRDEFSISLSSSISDYAGSVMGFMAVYYHDTNHLYKDYKLHVRIKKVLRSAMGLWVSIISADIAFLIVRPYFHYVMLLTGVEAGVAGALAHFLAFTVFNGIAIFSRSIFDYTRRAK